MMIGLTTFGRNYSNCKATLHTFPRFQRSKQCSSLLYSTKPGYLIALVDVHDKNAYKLYTDKTPGVVSQFGGKFIVRGPPIDLKEGGKWPASRMVVIEFESLEKANKFYHSPEYQSIIPLRTASSEGKIAIVEGVSPEFPSLMHL